MHSASRLPSKSLIFDYWKDRIFSLGFFIDWGEPGCWVCGHHYGSKYDIKRSDASWPEILRCWQRIPLQRCHIIPRSLGGANDTANMFLMCRECHDLAPNTNIPEVFFEWARSQHWFRRFLSKLSAAFDAYGIEAANQEEYYALIISDEFRLWASNRIGLHRPQSKYASLSSRLTASTLVGLAVHYRRTRRTRRAPSSTTGSAGRRKK
jgi:hypothetical protein